MYQVLVKEATAITRIEGGDVVLEGWAMVSEEVYYGDLVLLEADSIKIVNGGVGKNISLRDGFYVKVLRVP